MPCELRILIGMEASGVIRRRMRAAGHDAWSCDLRAAMDASEFHHHCDIFEVIEQPWDLAIFHPDCTYLTSSAEWAFGDGPYHQKIKPGTKVGAERRKARQDAYEFVRRLESCSAHIPYTAYENPVGALSRLWKPATQIIQPNWFGDDASKKTCLWLKGLPKLTPTKANHGRLVSTGETGEQLGLFGTGVVRFANQTDSGQNRLSPSADRWSERSETYPRIADAMVSQWLPYITANKLTKFAD